MNVVQIPTIPGAKMISLYCLLNEMLGGCGRVKKDHRNFFINEVPRNLSVSAGKNVLVPILGELFATISSNPGNNCVRISARRSENEVLLYIKKSEIRGFSFSGIRFHAA